jgi:hypothetical protein
MENTPNARDLSALTIGGLALLLEMGIVTDHPTVRIIAAEIVARLRAEAGIRS